TEPAMRRFASNLLVLVVSCCAGLFVIELGMRAAGIAYDASFYAADRDTGWALRPNTEGWYIGEDKSYIKINSDGMRDVEHRLEKAPHMLRVAVLGDSYAEGFNVQFDETFAAVLEKDLARCPGNAGKKVEVLNFGCTGYGTAQELVALRTR